ncbi:MAG: hypothetical protein ACO1OO_02000 [Flavisolibacter sp.]
MQQYLTIWDAVLGPLYIIILTLLAKRYRNKRYGPHHPLRPFFIPGLYVKFGGAIIIALLYQYYYPVGDTVLYHQQAVVINSALNDSFVTWLKLMMHLDYPNNPELYKYIVELPLYYDKSSFSVSAIAAVFGLFNGTTYIPIAFLFSVLCYTGIWSMYTVFTRIFPGYHKQLAVAFLFVPTMLVWSSAIFKDTLAMTGLGWMIFATFRTFVNKDFSLKNILLLIVGFFMVAVIKVYILIAFVPALTLWLLMTYSHRIPNNAARLALNLVFVATIALGFYFFSTEFEKELNRYSLSRVAATSAETRGWIAYSSGLGGSTYDLGEFEPTIWGMLSKFPAAVTVTLFRPYPWESTKIMVLLTSVESILFFFGTLYVLIKVGVIKVFKRIFSNPTLTFFLLFSLIFSFAVGISSYNFGALSRYKIPALPFYAALLLICMWPQSAVNKKPAQVNKLKKRPSLT